MECQQGFITAHVKFHEELLANRLKLEIPFSKGMIILGIMYDTFSLKKTGCIHSRNLT